MNRTASRYACAVLLPVIATSYGQTVHPLVDHGITLLFVLAVLMSAAFGGLGPGLLAATLSIAAVDYFFLAPVESLRVIAATDLLLLILFAGVAIASAGMVGLLRRW